MNKYKIQTYKELNLNIFSLISDGLPTGVFSPHLFDSYQQAHYEFMATVGTRCLSTFIDILIDLHSVEENGEYVELQPEALLIIKNTILDHFKGKWQKLQDLWNTPYDPLSPLKITLDEEYEDTLEVTEDTTERQGSDSMYGFNSEEAVPTDSSTESSSSKYTRQNPRKRRYTREGNIGNITKQQLIEQQREVLRYQIINEIYKDIASVVCRGKYL